jgi:hypothetical protein
MRGAPPADAALNGLAVWPFAFLFLYLCADCFGSMAGDHWRV